MKLFHVMNAIKYFSLLRLLIPEPELGIER